MILSISTIITSHANVLKACACLKLSNFFRINVPKKPAIVPAPLVINLPCHNTK